MNVVDSSAWIEYFADGPRAGVFAKPILDSKELLVPSVCVAEVYRFVLRTRGVPAAREAATALRRGKIVPLDEDLAIRAAALGHERGLALADSIVYASAETNGAELWTQDEDFKGLPGVRYFSKV